jgi:4'-phosphopantetheinyl transferase
MSESMYSSSNHQHLLPTLPPLGTTEVVAVEVGVEAADPEELSSILDEEERARARRFLFAHDRRRYQVARAALRLVLAHYLDHDPRALCFEVGPHGKPKLAGRAAGALAFNVSHSAGRALIAVARDGEVGIDLEVHRANVDIHALAARVLSPAEKAAFAAVPAEQLRPAFFRAWARKESFVKAIGEGLACPLDSFDMSLDAEVENALLACRHRSAAATRWTTMPLEVGTDAAAALTAHGPLRLERRDGSLWVFA